MNTHTFFFLILSIACGSGLTGCYTQFAVVDRSEKVASGQVADSTVDSSYVRQNVDTVRVKERETCFWQRDFFGRMRLRCYRSWYNDDWYDYYNRPWWYNDAYGFGSDDCDCNCDYSDTYTYYSNNYYVDNFHANSYYCRDYCYWRWRTFYSRSYHHSSSPGTSPSNTSPPAPGRRPVRNGVPTYRVPTSSSSMSASGAAPTDARQDSTSVQVVPEKSPRERYQVRQGVVPRERMVQQAPVNEQSNSTIATEQKSAVSLDKSSTVQPAPSRADTSHSTGLRESLRRSVR